jgi:hypothetical protein
MFFSGVTTEPPVREELAVRGPAAGLLLPLPGGVHRGVLHHGGERVRGAGGRLPERWHLSRQNRSVGPSRLLQLRS